jgi:hypothetical protein
VSCFFGPLSSLTLFLSPTNSQGKSLQAIANLGTEWNHEPHVVRPKCKCHLPPAMHEAPPYLLKLIPASIVTTMRDEIDEFASNNLGMTEPVSSKVASVRFACGRPVGHPERCDYQCMYSFGIRVSASHIFSSEHERSP